jgi:hypothetical protein
MRTSSLDVIDMAQITALALRYNLPVEDVLLIAINVCGIASERGQRRARLTVRLTRAPETSWILVVPLNADFSPFRLHGDELSLGEQVVGQVERVAADEAVGGYFRNGGLCATLNPNARSRCVGCAFCPNTLEAAADPRLSEERELDQLLDALRELHPRRDLTELQEVTVSTGCFEREDLAVAHLTRLRGALSRFGIRARLGFLSSVVHTDDAFARLAELVSPFVLRLTIECFARRDLLLKASKAALAADRMADLLNRAQAAGLNTSYTYIVGLDPLADLRAGVAQLAPHIDEFPTFQVYQAHNAIMAGFRADGADDLEFYLRARQEIEDILVPTGLRPAGWESYRQLWFFTFAGENLLTPVINAGARQGARP